MTRRHTGLHTRRATSVARRRSRARSAGVFALRRQGRIFAYLLLLWAVAFNLYQLAPEVAVRAPMLNDGVLHLLSFERAVDALSSGRDPTDPWLATVDLGYPLFHYYQHLPFVLPALLYLPLRGIVAPADFYHWLVYLLVSAFPLSVYWSMRRLRFPRLPAACAGLVASLLSTAGLYGFELTSYTWGGYGLYTQVWGMTLLPPALAACATTLRRGTAYLPSVALLAAIVLSHVVLGYIAVLSVVLTAALPALRPEPLRTLAPELWRRARRLATLLALAGLVAAYFLVPFWQDRPYLNRSVWELPSKYDSYGAGWVLGTLARGDLFDHGRFPSLTLLAAAGLALCLWRWRRERYRIPVLVALTWLLLYFGRPTWGALLAALPLSRELQLHRLIAGAHLGGILLMGLGLAWPWQWAALRRRPEALLVVGAATALLLAPVYQERAGALALNAAWMRQSQAAYAAEAPELGALVSWLQHAPPGRVYAGLGNNWGRSFTVGAVPVYGLLQGAGCDMLGYLYHAESLNADLEVLFDERRAEEYNLFDVRYVVAPPGHAFPSFVRPVRTFGRFRLYQVATPGYFDLVGSDATFAGGTADFFPAAARWLASDEPRAKEHPALLLDGAPPGRSVVPLARAAARIPVGRLPDAPPRGQVLRETVADGTYAAEVRVLRGSVLLLKETYQPGWQATLDGRAVPTMMLMPSYVGIRLPPGVHAVRFAYRPGTPHDVLLPVSLLTLVGIAIADWRRRRAAPMAHWGGGGAPRAAEPDPPKGEVALPATTPGEELGRGGRETMSGQVSGGRMTHPASTGVRTRWGIYLLFLSIYLVSAAGHFFSTDHVATYLTTQSLVERHSLAIKPINDTARGRDGQYYGAFGLGQSIAVAPLYLAGKAVDGVSPPAVKRYFEGVHLGDWGGTVPIFFVSLLNQFVTPLTCVLVFVFCVRLGFSQPAALATSGIFGFGTVAWVYARDSFQHPLESLLLLSCLYILVAHRADLRPRHALLAGMALAFGILTRLDLLLVAPAIAIYLCCIAQHARITDDNARGGNPARRAIQARPQQAAEAAARRAPGVSCRGVSRDIVRYLLVFAAPIVLALGVILWLNYLKFGNVLTFDAPAQAKGFSTPLWLGLYGDLFSVGRSIFLYSPPTLLALAAFRPFLRQHRAEALLFLSIIAIYLLFYAHYGYWDGGWAWGPRFLVAIIPLMVIPAGYAFCRPRGRAAVALVTCLGVAVQVLGVAINYDFVYWDWAAMKLSPDNAFLFVPDISPIPTHARDLFQGRHVDLWLLEVYRQFGIAMFLATLAVPLVILATAVVLLRGSGMASPPAE